MKDVLILIILLVNMRANKNRTFSSKNFKGSVVNLTEELLKIIRSIDNCIFVLKV